MRPLIGITCSFEEDKGRFFLSQYYVSAVIRAGGIPVILPGANGLKINSSYLKAMQGIILAGGGDIDPILFGEEPIPGLGEITPARDNFEMLLARAALREKMPILGICRGIQVLNVACGGTVIQHLPAEIKKPLKHSQSAPRWHATHNITIKKASLLNKITKADCILVNSFHHQAIRDLAPGFVISAWSKDGVIEAVENPQYKFVIGIQWHPECMEEKDKNSRMLFKAFIDAARTSN